MKKTYFIYLFFILLAVHVSLSQAKDIISSPDTIPVEQPRFIQIKTDSLFNSHQIISQLILNKSSFERFYIDFGFNKSELKTTSSFGMINDALAAINGGFFDRDKGGSVTYLEKNDSVISKTKPGSEKWSKPDSLTNGAIIITKDSVILIQPAKSDLYYELSNRENAVLVTGPLLLYKSEKTKLPEMTFSHTRHPRTCLCETKESLIFITIDGRSKNADGMNLYEVQLFLESIHCLNAVNLDGGGSTTMWIKDKGIVNFPSDLTERPVSNTLVIKRKNNNR